MDLEDVSLQQYADSVANLAKRGENYEFHNEGEDHARIVFENIFKNAKEEVFIVARALTNPNVSNSPKCIESLGRFLELENVSLNAYRI